MSDIMATPPQPVNYTGLQIQPDPVGNFLKAANTQAQTGLMNAQASQAGAMANMQQFQLQRQQQYYPMLQQALQNPSPSNFAALSAMFPDQHEAISSAYQMERQAQQQQIVQPMAQAYVSLLNNRPDLALNIVQQQRDALVNSGADPNDPTYQQKLQHADVLMQQIQNDPKGATGLLGATLSSFMPPDQFSKTFADYMNEPATLQKATAEATTAQAGAAVAPQQAQANLAQTQANVANINNQMQQRVAAFGLDQQKFQTDTQLRLSQLRYQQMVPNMASGMAEQQAQAVADSQLRQQEADRTQGLAQQIQSMAQSGQWTSGIGGSAKMTLQDVLGSQDAVNDLKKSYAAARASGIFSQIQNGKTTDADLKTINQGFPQDESDPGQLVAFMNSWSNVNRRIAQYNDAKADWISAAGSMGKLPRDGTVLGVQVPAGTSFNDFMARGLANAQGNVTPPNAPPGALPRYMQYGQ
ncbi:hypothetical protein [Paraburkholderia sp. GAS82]|uniref:hypothetical protein n=1 Tax=Paraburkholderia sp. GAS82 TaxID=3035137 RepID=UPI003D1A4610